MSSEEEIEMEAAGEEQEAEKVISFQLQFEKPIPSQVKIAEWNPEKDLLAMVTDDNKIILHRFNWQRLWTVSPGKCVTSLCWRPDGKVIAVGFEDGYIALHDVENGKLLKISRYHLASVVCLNWVEDAQEDVNNVRFVYEDRTARFFPPPPRVPQTPGLSSGDAGLMDDLDNSFCELCCSSNRLFNILCSGDKNGTICFSIFGIFSIGKINIQSSPIRIPFVNMKAAYHLVNVSLYKVALSNNLCQLIILTYGDLNKVIEEHKSEAVEYGGKDEEGPLDGLHCLLLDTSIFHNRKSELFQVAQQASSIENLIEVLRGSLSVMHTQWFDAMDTFHKKFDPLSSLISHHGLESNSQEEFLSFLFGARTSPPLHQFLVNSLGEPGLKRVVKAIGNAGKELHSIVREHLQPAAEIIGFRIGEISGLSKWRARYQGIGLDEKCMDSTIEKAGMFLVQVERFVRVLAIVLYQFQNFFNWLTKCMKLLNSEPADQVPQCNSEHVIIFLKFHLNNDIVGQLLEVSDTIEVDLDTTQRLEELVEFGGFSDVRFLGRTLSREFAELENSFRDALSMPFTTVSKKVTCQYFMPLVSSSAPSCVPTSMSYYKDPELGASCSISHNDFTDLISFRVPENSLGISNSIAIVRGFINFLNDRSGESSLESVIFSLPHGFQCIDLSLYKEGQIVLLLNEVAPTLESAGQSSIMVLQTCDLPFTSLSASTSTGFWKLHELKDSIVDLSLEIGKVRSIPHLVTKPLAVSASRGVACVFTSRKCALVYILDEDEEEASDMEEQLHDHSKKANAV